MPRVSSTIFDPDHKRCYQTQYTDPTTGDILAQARWYSPGTGTFRSRDTYSGNLNTPVSLNRYTYAGNNPIRYWDPTGYCSEGLGLADIATTCTPQVIDETVRAIGNPTGPNQQDFDPSVGLEEQAATTIRTAEQEAHTAIFDIFRSEGYGTFSTSGGSEATGFTPSGVDSQAERSIAAGVESAFDHGARSAGKTSASNGSIAAGLQGRRTHAPPLIQRPLRTSVRSWASWFRNDISLVGQSSRASLSSSIWAGVATGARAVSAGAVVVGGGLAAYDIYEDARGAWSESGGDGWVTAHTVVRSTFGTALDITFASGAGLACGSFSGPVGAFGCAGAVGFGADGTGVRVFDEFEELVTTNYGQVAGDLAVNGGAFNHTDQRSLRDRLIDSVTFGPLGG